MHYAFHSKHGVVVWNKTDLKWSGCPKCMDNTVVVKRIRNYNEGEQV